MKIIMIVTLAIALDTAAFAESKASKESKKLAVRNAKSICLMKNTFIRGKKLDECIQAELEKQNTSQTSKRL